MTLRTDILTILADAAEAEEQWRDFLDEADDRPLPPKAWENRDDTLADLAHRAVEVLRDLHDQINRRVDVGVLIRQPDPELMVMVWDGEGSENDEWIIEEGGDTAIVQAGECFTVCPRCARVDAGVVEVDRAERWNRARVSEVTQRDTMPAYEAGQHVERPNPLAGLPILDVTQDHRGSDFHTDHYRCPACAGAIRIPVWIKVNWS